MLEINTRLPGSSAKYFSQNFLYLIKWEKRKWVCIYRARDRNSSFLCYIYCLCVCYLRIAWLIKTTVKKVIRSRHPIIFYIPCHQLWRLFFWRAWTFLFFSARIATVLSLTRLFFTFYHREEEKNFIFNVIIRNS